MSVFQLLLICLESTLHCVNSPTAEGTVLQLIFIPSSSFLFPPFFHVITICCSNKMPKPVIYLFWVLTEKRWALIIDQNSNRCAGFPFFTCMVLLNVGWRGISSCCAYRHSAQAVQVHGAAEVGQHAEIFADCKAATSFPQQAGWGPAVRQK